MTRFASMVVTSSLLAGALVGCARPDDVDRSAAESVVAPTCEPLGGTVSGVAFTDDEATNAIDMADTATAAELTAIRGIGPSIAERIIAARPLRSHADPLAALDAVGYVGPSILEALRDAAYGAWCALDDGRQSCCVDIGCEAAAAGASVAMSDADAKALLDWANRASTVELTSVCRVGSTLATAIVAARPLRTIAELEAVRGIGDATMRYLLDLEGFQCSTKGSVLDEWCGLADAACTCEATGTDPPDGYALTETEAEALGRAEAQEFFNDNADFIWEEYCQFSYDDGAGYDELEVIAFCETFVAERFVPAAGEAARSLAGIPFADASAAAAAADALAEQTFFELIGDWMQSFGAALSDAMGA